MQLQTEEIHLYSQVQNIARATIDHLKGFIRAGVSEILIAEEAERFMRSKGVRSFWYYDLAAFVLVGKRSTLSISGREYEPSNAVVQSQDIISVDLSPQMNDRWGDFARTFVVKDGIAKGTNVRDMDDEIDEVREGISAGELLHDLLKTTVTEDHTFGEVFTHMNEAISKMGFINLDFKGNLGHTIEKEKNDRRYIEAGNPLRLGDAGLFTFEPHIRQQSSGLGFKREDIYYFRDRVLTLL